MLNNHGCFFSIFNYKFLCASCLGMSVVNTMSSVSFHFHSFTVSSYHNLIMHANVIHPMPWKFVNDLLSFLNSGSRGSAKGMGKKLLKHHIRKVHAFKWWLKRKQKHNQFGDRIYNLKMTEKTFQASWTYRMRHPQCLLFQLIAFPNTVHVRIASQIKWKKEGKKNYKLLHYFLQIAISSVWNDGKTFIYCLCWNKFWHYALITTRNPFSRSPKGISCFF